MCYPATSLEARANVQAPTNLFISNPQVKLGDSSSRSVSRKMATQLHLSQKLLSLEEKIIAIERSILIKRVWKLTIIAAAALSVLSLAFVLWRTPNDGNVTTLSQSMGAHDGRIKVLEDQQANISRIQEKQTETIRQDMGAMESRINERMNRIEESLGKLTDRLNKYIEDKYVGNNGKRLPSSYRRAVTAEPGRLAKTLPIAQDILALAKKKGIPVSREDIKDFASITLPLLDKKYRDPKVKNEVWKTVVQLASASTYRKQPYGGSSLCKDGQTSLGAGGGALRNETIADCNVSYIGGDLFLENVRFINSEFDVAQTPQGREFLLKLLQSDSSTISINTSSRSE